MEQISLQGKTNFFEKRVADYQRAGVIRSKNAAGEKEEDSKDFVLDDDF